MSVRHLSDWRKGKEDRKPGIHCRAKNRFLDWKSVGSPTPLPPPPNGLSFVLSFSNKMWVLQLAATYSFTISVLLFCYGSRVGKFQLVKWFEIFFTTWKSKGLGEKVVALSENRPWERPTMTSDDFWWFSTDRPTYLLCSTISTILRQIFGSHFGPNTYVN